MVACSTRTIHGSPYSLATTAPTNKTHTSYHDTRESILPGDHRAYKQNTHLLSRYTGVHTPRRPPRLQTKYTPLITIHGSPYSLATTAPTNKTHTSYHDTRESILPGDHRAYKQNTHLLSRYTGVHTPWRPPRLLTKHTHLITIHGSPYSLATTAPTNKTHTSYHDTPESILPGNHHAYKQNTHLLSRYTGVHTPWGPPRLQTKHTPLITIHGSPYSLGTTAPTNKTHTSYHDTRESILPDDHHAYKQNTHLLSRYTGVHTPWRPPRLLTKHTPLITIHGSPYSLATTAPTNKTHTSYHDTRESIFPGDHRAY